MPGAEPSAHLHRRWPAMACAFALLLAPFVGARPAQAADVIEFGVQPAAADRSEYYGAAEPAVRRIVIGPETTTVLVDLGPSIAGGDVDCSSEQGVIADASWTRQQWDTAPTHPVELRPGTIRPGSTYGYHCTQGQAREVFFTVVAAIGAPTTVELTANPDELVHQDVLLDRADPGTDPRPVAPGDVLRVTGPPGTWGTPAEGAAATVTVNCRDFSTAPAGDVSISPDGATVQATIPADLDPGCRNGLGSLRVSTLAIATGGSTTGATTKVRWTGELKFPDGPRAASTTSLRLDRPLTLSFLPTTAIITVRTDVVPAVRGRVDVYVDGALVPSGVEVPRAMSSTVRLLLATLGRGKHTVVAVFRENQSVLGSSSPDVPLRIVV